MSYYTKNQVKQARSIDLLTYLLMYMRKQKLS